MKDLAQKVLGAALKSLEGEGGSTDSASFDDACPAPEGYDKISQWVDADGNCYCLFLDPTTLTFIVEPCSEGE